MQDFTMDCTSYENPLKDYRERKSRYHSINCKALVTKHCILYNFMRNLMEYCHTISKDCTTFKMKREIVNDFTLEHDKSRLQGKLI